MDYSYNDYYENYELNTGVYSFDLTDRQKQLLDEAIWLVDNKVSIRQVSKEFGRCKSVIHKELNTKLKYLSYELYKCVQRQLRLNKLKYFK